MPDSQTANPSSAMSSVAHTADRNHTLPAGIVTFLFTDIEGSTDLAQLYPDEMPELLARHHAILHQAVTFHRGFVFQIVGDAFSVAFHTPQDALNAAVLAQRLLHQEAWRPAPIRVRMGINTGAAQVGDNDDRSGGYTGYSTLARAQRVMSAAHGGQVLLSSSSAELVHGELSAGVTLRDMGVHRLKGFLDPDHLWQVDAPDLPQSFPRLHTLSEIPSNLPKATNRFVGREHELQTIKEQLTSPVTPVRMLTLVGTGGVGKTRLALQTATDLRDYFNDRVYFINLAPTRDVESVVAAIAHTLGVREKSERSHLEEIKAQLQTYKTLLVLDNFEQVTVAAPFVAELLRDCSKLTMLVTSRELLHITGEVVYPVLPLVLPQADSRHASLDQLAKSGAVELFVERARSVKPNFQLTSENAQAIAELCLRVDGLPLAIELAAARVNLLSPRTLVDQLGQRLKVLRGGARDLPIRQQTLRNTIDWSYALLNEGEQSLFKLLSLFSGASLESVTVVANQTSRFLEIGFDVLEGLSSLVDKSLIRLVDQNDGTSRLVMLETIREYASMRLDEDFSLAVDAHRLHATYFAEWTYRQREHFTAEGRQAALAPMVIELENIRTAWGYWFNERDYAQLCKFTDSLWRLYDQQGWYQATVSLTKDLLTVLASTPSTPERVLEQITLQTSLARALLPLKGYTPEAEEAYKRAMELCEGLGEIPQLFPVLRGLSTWYMSVANMEKASQIGEQILTLAEHLDDARMRVEAHLVLGACLSGIDAPLALEHLEKGIASYDANAHVTQRYRLGNNPGVVCLVVSALVLWTMGYPDRALKRVNAAIALSRQLNHPLSMAYAHFHAGLLHLWRREPERTSERAQVLLDIAEEHEFPFWRALSMFLGGISLSHTGSIEDGLSDVRHGISDYQRLKTPPVFWPMIRILQAEAYALAGKPEEGLALIEESISIVPLPDALRVKGDVLLAISRSHEKEAERCYQKSLDIAVQTKTPMLELQAAVRLHRVWSEQGKRDQAHTLLRDVYQKFTEGFTSADLLEAKVLLDN